MKKPTVEQKKATKEAKEIIKDLQGDSSKFPDKEKNILQWTTGELKTYIMKETKGMNPTKKMKFANDVLKRIKEEKDRQKR